MLVLFYAYGLFMATNISSPRDLLLLSLQLFIRLFLVIMVAGAFTCTTYGAGLYYVSPEGDDLNEGTRESPWRTAGYAGRQAQAGDTVIFLPGDYSDTLEPLHSGTAEAPITFKAEQRRQARLIGTDTGAWQEGRGGRIRLDEVDHIRIEGFHVEDTSVDESTGGWLWGNKPQHIEVVDCYFTGGHRWVLFRLTEARHIRILDSDFARMRRGGDMVHINHSEDVLVEGNSFTFALHSLFCIRYGSRAVVRGNVFHSGVSRNFENGDNTMTLVENNILTNGYNGGGSAGPGNQTVGIRTIIRQNQVFKNYGMTWSMAAASTRDTMHNRVYHNVFHGNYGYPWIVSAARGNFRDLVYQNNIFAENDPYGSQTQLVINGGGTESVQVIKNAVYSGKPGHDALFRYGLHPLGLNQAQSASSNGLLGGMDRPLTHTTKSGQGVRIPIAEWFHFAQSESIAPEERSLIYIGTPDQLARVVEVDAKTSILTVDRAVSWRGGAGIGFHVPVEHGGIFRDNIEGNPGFADPSRFDFSLKEDSTLLDAGTPLTYARSSGRGRELEVEDAYAFFDGFGVTGQPGDLIAVGNSSKQARVVHADVMKGVLQLDRELEWKAGDPVSLPWSGNAPDIGAFEHGNSGPARVQVVAETVMVQPGESVNLHALVYGQMTAPLTYEWQLGDGTVAKGENVIHTYEDARDYGIRVRVTDANGEVALGVGYVVVEAEKDPDVLIHSTFDHNDDEWWKHWQFYRGRRGTGYAHFRNIIDQETGEGYIRVFPREPNPAPLPGFIHPRNWDIDKYPVVYLRYRIKPGTPLAIFIRPFPSAHYILESLDSDQDSRRYYLAGTKGVGGDNSGKSPRSPLLPEADPEQLLIDDGRWHEIRFDVRDIRRKFPDVQMLQAMHIGDLEVDGGAKVSFGDEYFLSEVYIGK